MTKRALAMSALIGTLCASPAEAGWKSGNDLHRECSSATLLVTVMSYSIAVADADEMSTMKVSYCIPDGVTTGQMGGVVCKYITDNPAIRHLPGPILVRSALTQSWPCPK